MVNVYREIIELAEEIWRRHPYKIRINSGSQ